ncbi:MAG: histone deacetylase family protein [Gammaproteobacteria bacterium]|jgi:acetoin utilization deacetylase AcuC-like enzyme|nr:histone deacetylase family protein [Gammaproteobacteria bacterium]
MSAADRNQGCLLFTHADCLLHRPPAGHPDSPQRLHTLLAALELVPGLDRRDAPLATAELLQLAHEDRYLQQLLAVQQKVLDSSDPERIEALDEDTWLGRDTLPAALRCVGAACAAVDAVLDAQSPIRRAFCAVRPPGHHAERNQAMGFCFYASTAIAALHAVNRHGLRRVALVDFDVHQANGSADILAHNEHIMLFDSHQAELYPFMLPPAQKAANIMTEALPQGCTGDYFRTVWQQRLLPGLQQFRPELIIISAGFDAHQLDPLAQCVLQREDFDWLSAQLCDIADRYAGGRMVSSLEGGYHLDALTECVVAHVRLLSGQQHRTGLACGSVPGNGNQCTPPPIL